MISDVYGYTQTPTCPGPEVLVTLTTPLGQRVGKGISCKAVFDSGSPMTCMPEYMVRELVRMQLALREVGYVNVRGVNSSNRNGRRRSKYEIIIQIGACVFLVEVVTVNRHYILIGRDILNNFEFVLDGPNKGWRAYVKC